MKSRAIPPRAWRSKGAAALARSLLGKHLVRRWPDGRLEARMIVEVEAYDGERDLACHAAKGRTERTDTLYLEGGVWYVYLCYGIHEMLNLVVGPRDWPSAVLIRGVEGWIGPGRLTRALGIDRRFNRAPAAPATGLWIEDRGVRLPRGRIRSGPRVGVHYAGPIWAEKPWRFTLTGADGSPPGSPSPPRTKNPPGTAPAASVCPGKSRPSRSSRA